RSYSLEDLAVRFIGKELHPQAAGGQQELALDGPGELEETAVRAAAVRELSGALTSQLEERRAAGLLTDVELPVAVVLTRMEQAGIAADTDYLHELEKHFDAGVRSAAEQAYEQIGREVNLSSPKQLQEVLFGDLDMPKTRKTKTGYTTAAGTLADRYAETDDPSLAHVLAPRGHVRRRQTVQAVQRAVAPDGRIHSTDSQTIAPTGRLSSAAPNLQNIPIGNEEGMRIRAGF